MPELEDRYTDDPSPIKVAVIGGGLSGILAGALLPAKVPGIDLTIYEKNDELGGTWLENSYPGVRCDIPGHVYQSSFAPKADWSEMFPQGKEILEYWKEVARQHDVYRYVSFHQKIEKLEWSAERSVWVISLLDLSTGEQHESTADFVFTAIGRFNEWKIPDFAGMQDFQGPIVHTAAWPKDLEVKGKNVAVIGNGSSGIQITPNLQRIVNRLDHYTRSPTWIAPSWAGDDNDADPSAAEAEAEAEKKRVQDPSAYLAYRKEMEDKYWRRMKTYMAGTPENAKLKEMCQDVMRKNENEYQAPMPTFSPNCRRLTPGPGYLAALAKENVCVIHEGVTRFTKTGIEATDGKQRDVDVVICATGFNIDMAPPFPIIANGKDLKDAWAHDGEYGSPYTYLGMSSPGFPNLMYIHGPHGTGLSGLVPHSVETQLTYMSKILRKLSREGYRTIQPSLAATDEFQAYSDTFFASTVLSQDCRSWYNGGKPGVKIHGLFPGSSAAATIARKDPRWEDYEFTLRSGGGNRFAAFLGNGRTRKELEEGTDMTSYLRLPGSVELKDLHEEWWSFP